MKATSNPTATSHAVLVPERTLNGRPMAAAAIACATTSCVTSRISNRPGSADGRADERWSPCRPGLVALTVHLQARPQAARRATYEPNGLPGWPGCSVGSTPLLRDSHRVLVSATGCAFPPPARLYLPDMAGHRGPRQV